MQFNTGEKMETLLSVVVPCYNEERTLKRCVERLMDTEDAHLRLEVIIVDDCSSDNSLMIAHELRDRHPAVLVFQHERNRGKGAALRTGFSKATGQFVAVQDADLEYNPMELKQLLEPLITNRADVVVGSRFLSNGAHRVLYFWHSLGNRFLTFVSNMFTDLNLTDMECCYKVFRREIIQSIDLCEDRFGFEPEIIAKVAHMRVRIYEIGISYSGRTYGEGKKIGARDGFRALYCILRYNLHHVPMPLQFLFYLLVGGSAAFVNLIAFLGLLNANLPVIYAAPVAFAIAAAVNYVLSTLFLFRHRARWKTSTEILIYVGIVVCVGFLDLTTTRVMLSIGLSASTAKLVATGVGLLLNFAGRRYLVFPEAASGSWKPADSDQ